MSDAEVGAMVLDVLVSAFFFIYLGLHFALKTLSWFCLVFSNRWVKHLFWWNSLRQMMWL